MFEMPNERMVCDSSKGDGHIDFYDEYCEWINRSNGEGFKIFYKDIADVKILYGLKKTVIVSLKNGEKINLYLYKADTLRKLLYDAVQRVNKKVIEEPAVEVEPEPKIDNCISELERLAALHEKGALTDEEFAMAKKKILGIK